MGHRRRDGGRGEVQRNEPGNFVLGHGQRATNLRQYDIGQRDRHAEQQVCQLYRHQDQPVASADAEDATLGDSEARERCGLGCGAGGVAHGARTFVCLIEKYLC